MINIYHVVLRENILSSPFVPNRRFLGEELASSMANLAASLAAAEANSEDVEATNQMNYRIAHEANMYSQAQFDENMQWLRYQYQKNREYALQDRDYNSPSKVVQRLVQAGINPAAYFGSGQTQIPGSTGVGAPAQSNFHVAHFEPKRVGDFISQGVGRAVDAFYQSQMMNAQVDKTKQETEAQRINNITRFMENVQKLRTMSVDIEERLSRRDLNNEQRAMLEKQREDLQNHIGLFLRTIDDQAESAKLANQRTKREMAHMDFEEMLSSKKLQIDAALAESNIRLNSAQSSLIMNQIGLVIQEQSTEFERGRNISADTLAKSIQNRLSKLILSEKEFESDKKESSKFLKNLSGFSHYVANLVLPSIVGVFK